MSKAFKVELGDGKKLETFSVHSACDMIDAKELILNPEYQTGLRWKGLQQAKLIDSVVNGLDLPKLYFRTVRKGADDIYEVVDGQQRLRAISEFRKDGFKLNSGEFKGKVFTKLPHPIRRRINDFDLHVMILSGERWSDEVIRD